MGDRCVLDHLYRTGGGTHCGAVRYQRKRRAGTDGGHPGGEPGGYRNICLYVYFRRLFLRNDVFGALGVSGDPHQRPEGDCGRLCGAVCDHGPVPVLYLRDDTASDAVAAPYAAGSGKEGEGTVGDSRAFSRYGSGGDGSVSHRDECGVEDQRYADGGLYGYERYERLFRCTSARCGEVFLY